MKKKKTLHITVEVQYDDDYHSDLSFIREDLEEALDRSGDPYAEESFTVTKVVVTA